MGLASSAMAIEHSTWSTLFLCFLLHITNFIFFLSGWHRSKLSIVFIFDDTYSLFPQKEEQQNTQKCYNIEGVLLKMAKLFFTSISNDANCK